MFPGVKDASTPMRVIDLLFMFPGVKDALNSRLFHYHKDFDGMLLAYRGRETLPPASHPHHSLHNYSSYTDPDSASYLNTVPYPVFFSAGNLNNSSFLSMWIRFPGMDPFSGYGSGSKSPLNADPNP